MTSEKTMTRDELERTYWRRFPRAGAAFISELLADADAYATTQAGITAERRAALDVRARRQLAAAAHLYTEGDRRAACGNTHRPAGPPGHMPATAARDVDCHGCRRTGAYRAALAAAGITVGTGPPPEPVGAGHEPGDLHGPGEG